MQVPVVLIIILAVMPGASFFKREMKLSFAFTTNFPMQLGKFYNFWKLFAISIHFCLVWVASNKTSSKDHFFRDTQQLELFILSEFF